MDISFIIVNHQSEDFLKNCLASLREKIQNIAFEVIVVNNEKESLTEDQIGFGENLRLINCQDNIGFARACNLGVKSAQGKLLFFLNPDTLWQEGDLKNTLTKFDDDHVGIVAPRLLLKDDTVQPWSCGFETTLWDIVRNNFGVAKSKKLWEKTETEVDWASGAALIIRKDIFEKVGGFDENFFMYFEDADLCKRIKKLGYKILVTTQICIIHFGGQSYSQKNNQKQQYYRSQDFYFAKHFGKNKVWFLQFLRKFVLLFK